MSVISTVNKDTYTLTGAGTAFAFSSKIFDKDDLTIIRKDTAGVETVLTRITDYTVSAGPWPTGGTVTTVINYADGTLVIKGTLPRDQQYDYTINDPFPANSHEDNLDRAVLLIQEIHEVLTRIPQLKAVSNFSGLTFPEAVANKIISWNSAGTDLENRSTVDLSVVTVTAFAETLLDDATAGAMLTTLGITAFVQTLLDDETAAAFMTTLGITALAQTFLDDSTTAAMRETIESSQVSERNIIFNGKFDAVKNAGPVALTNVPEFSCVDRWTVFQNTLENSTATRVASGLANFPNALRIGRDSGDTATSAILMVGAARTLDSIPLAGKTVELTVRLKAGANFSGANINVGVLSGTGTDESTGGIGGWTGSATVIGVAQVITASYVTYTFTGTVASDATQLGVRFFYSPTGTAGADDWFEATGVQVKEDKSYSEYEHVPYAQELQRSRPDPYECGRLSNLVTASSAPFTQCHYIPHNGNLILISGVPEVIPDGALAASGGVNGTYTNCSINKTLGQSLAANTFYYIYVYMLNGVMTMDFSTTSHVIDPDYGVGVKSGDRSMSVIGICHISNLQYTISSNSAANPTVITTSANHDLLTGHDVLIAGSNSTPSIDGSHSITKLSATTFSIPVNVTGAGSAGTVDFRKTYGGARGQTISSYYNRFRATLTTSLSGTTTSATAVALAGGATLPNGQPTNNRLDWVQWFDETPRVRFFVNGGCSVITTIIQAGLGVNSTTVIDGIAAKSEVPSTVNNSVNMSGQATPTDATGYYFCQGMALTAAGTVTLDGTINLDGIMV